MMYRLKKFEAPDLLESQDLNPRFSYYQRSSLIPRFQRRIFCTTFEYSHDFDEMGILFHIATNGHTEKWQNPHATNRVTVTSSQV